MSNASQASDGNGHMQTPHKFDVLVQKKINQNNGETVHSKIYVHGIWHPSCAVNGSSSWMYKWSRPYPEQSSNFAESSGGRRQLVSVNKGSECSKKCGRFCTLHSPEQTPPQLVDGQHGVDIQSLLTACLWDLQDSVVVLP